MLTITTPSIELFDDTKGEFITIKPQTINLEHSLVSISKWESKWNKSFLNKDEKTIEETIDYVKCMTISQNINDTSYDHLTANNLKEVQEYLAADMTATKLPGNNKSINREIITAEIIYYWMIVLNIPFECQKWHLNRLLMLINVCNLKNTPPKKMSASEMASRNASINASRRNTLESRG